MILLHWLTIGFVATGFMTLISMKKRMENKVAVAMDKSDQIEEMEHTVKPIIWWIGGAVLWGIMSIFLIVWSFAS